MEKQQKDKVNKDMIGSESTHEYFRVTSMNSESRPGGGGLGRGIEHEVHTVGHTYIFVSCGKLSQSPMVLPSSFRTERRDRVSRMNSATTHAALAPRHRILMFRRIPAVRPTRLTAPPAHDAHADVVRVRKRRRRRVPART